MASKMNDAISSFGEDKSSINDDTSYGLKAYKAMVEGQEKIVVAEAEHRIKVIKALEEKAGVEQLKDRLKNEKLSADARRDIQEKLAKEEADIQNRSILISAKYRDNLYKQSSIEQKRRMAQEKVDALKNAKEEIKEKAAFEIAMAEGNEAKINEIKKKQRSDTRALAKETNKSNLELEKIKALESLQKSVSNIDQKMDKMVDQAMALLSQYKGVIDARLQGIGGYDEIAKTVKTNLGASIFVKQTAMLENVAKAVQSGIAYNVEQRAFLATVSDRIATTFDAFDSNLTRLIRLQQADSTAARLGMEAALTRQFNAMFSDTSYLNGMYDAVSSAIIDANSQMTRNEASEFEYIVQKWMGSLYALGVSDSFVNQIAQGLNYLGTGNVQALAGNESLQTLFAMAASQGGGDYADLLLNGLNAENTNALLESMVKYLKSIAESSENQVVKSAYGGVFGLSLSDMRAITNLSASDINSITKATLSYGQALGELGDQLGAYGSRMTLAEKMNTLIDNATLTLGEGIANNPAFYALWKITSMTKNATGGIHLPAVSVLGNMVDLSAFTIEDIMQAGLIGASSFGLIGSVISGLQHRGGLDLDAWGFDETTTRGQGFMSSRGGTSRGTSMSSYVGTSSGSDYKSASLAGAADEADETSKVTNKNAASTEHGFDELYESLFDKDRVFNVKITNEFVNTRPEMPTNLFTEDGGLPVVIMRVADGEGGTISIPVQVTNEGFDTCIQNKLTEQMMPMGDITGFGF